MGAGDKWIWDTQGRACARTREVAQFLPPPAAAIEPGTKASEDKPAGTANASDEGRPPRHLRQVLSHTTPAYWPCFPLHRRCCKQRGNQQVPRSQPRHPPQGGPL